MSSKTSLLILVAALGGSLACSAARDVDNSGHGGLKPGDPGYIGPEGGDGGFAADAGGGGDDCDEDSKQVYVITVDNALYRFEPLTLKFTRIGTVSCPGSFGTPFSMAVDRKGIAWVNWTDGTLNKVSTKDAKCSPTGFAVGQSGFKTFGMAFVSEGSMGETLFVAEYGGKGIGRIDTGSLGLTYVGSYGALGPAELTGTGGAKMFGLFHDSSSVAELDRATAKVIGKKAVPGLDVGMAWAFAHWGGDFWLFTAPTGKSQVTQFNFETGTADTVKTGLTITIVGAGVSTCAPTARPK